MSDSEVDYNQMYLTMVRASEQAIGLLIRAQRQCEEQYVLTAASEDQPEIAPMIPFSTDSTKGK